MELEQRITEVESRLAFQESTLQELNAALTDQQLQLGQLQELLKNLHGQLAELNSRDQSSAGDEPPPPHY